MQSVIEQYENILAQATAAIEQERYGDALGWLRAEVTAIEAASVSAPAADRPGMIYAKMIEAMRLIRPVGKDGQYDEGGTRYKFRTVDGTVNAVGPALAKVGIIPIPIMRKLDLEWGSTARGTPRRQATVQVTYRFTAEDGSYLDAELEVESFNMSDKAVGVAMSVAYRIALLQVFCIPTGDPDPDSSHPETGTAPALSKPLADYLLHAIHRWPVERLKEAWDLLTAHVPGDTRIHGDGSERVWWEPFADRYAGEVLECKNKDELADLWKRLGEFGLGFLTGKGITVAQRIKDRNAHLVKVYQAALTECRDVIESATDAADLDHAAEVVRTHLTNHRIPAADAMAFSERMAVRRDEVKAAEAAAAAAAMAEDEPQVGYPEGG